MGGGWGGEGGGLLKWINIIELFEIRLVNNESNLNSDSYSS